MMDPVKRPYILSFLVFLIIVYGCSKTERDYWKDGVLKSEIPYDARGEIHGTATWYYENGDPMVEATYKHGALDGKLVRWIRGGVKMTEDNYLDGALHGKSIEWDYDGRKTLEKEYSHDTLHGIYREWHKGGLIMIEGEYWKGNMHGQWIYWDIAGNIMARGKYDHGTGYKTLYSPIGNEIGKVRVENNIQLEEFPQ
jgi:antitoxin component YwqK of YwqJK toxin-antitoxin module